MESIARRRGQSEFAPHRERKRDETQSGRTEKEMQQQQRRLLGTSPVKSEIDHVPS